MVIDLLILVFLEFCFCKWETEGGFELTEIIFDQDEDYIRSFLFQLHGRVYADLFQLHGRVYAELSLKHTETFGKGKRNMFFLFSAPVYWW